MTDNWQSCDTSNYDTNQRIAQFEHNDSRQSDVHLTMTMTITPINLEWSPWQCLVTDQCTVRLLGERVARLLPLLTRLEQLGSQRDVLIGEDGQLNEKSDHQSFKIQNIKSFNCVNSRSFNSRLEHSLFPGARMWRGVRPPCSPCWSRGIAHWSPHAGHEQGRAPERWKFKLCESFHNLQYLHK